MKVPFPLSLKISLWLLLNLVLLGAAAVGLLLAQAGPGLDAMVRGPAGQRLQQLASAIAGEFAAAEPAARTAVLDRFNATYGAEFFVFHREAPLEMTTLPPEVMVRVAERPLPVRILRRSGDRAPPPGETPRVVNGLDPLPSPPPRALEESHGRFLVRTDAPPAFWLGARVRLGARPPPAVLVARVDSWWGVMRLLDLQPWLFAAGGVLVLSVLFWTPLVHGITRDLRSLTAATEKIAEGKFETRVTTARRDELGRLGESVNMMAARLDALVNGQKRFLGDVAHELGSPLARLQLATEILDQHADSALRAQIDDVREEVQQMNVLVNELLAFTKAGLRPRDATLAAIGLDAVIADVLTREDPSGRVRVEPTSLVVRADRSLLARALGNLVRNALRYAGDSGSIHITTQREGKQVIVALDDEGPGVPPEALARLGEPFYRPESARTRESGGVGLGLAIVRSSIAACGGDVRFANRSPRGFRAEVVLTAAAPLFRS